MGRLARNWLAPLLLAVVVLVGINTVVQADYLPKTSELTQYLKSHSLGVYNQTVNNYQQVFYPYNNRQIQLTNQGYNHVSAMSSGPYVVWEGLIGNGGQIFLYNVLTKATLQLTSIGTNEFPGVSQNGTVTWQTWDGQQWQVMYYNGLLVQAVTNDADHSSVRPVTDGHRVVYATQLGPDSWQAKAYDMASGKTTTISEGDTASTAYPNITPDGVITTAFSQLPRS